ncbi:hypothetical protein [Nocardia sp. alder85J]|uniref:hypothetical protein n=1 Tax=Nocardia sp. alder85J TaxID=2862949 RepID=UPI001CD7B373|nr:hypothetical protein [Nocardia sp. alder85J]MCX4094555.1 hypothetical protein [Nocardia sp. alder85J]
MSATPRHATDPASPKKIGDADVVIAVRDRRITRGGTVATLAYNARRRPVITVDVTTRRTSIDTGTGSDLPAL